MLPTRNSAYPLRPIILLLALALVVLLACGDETTNITEAPPPPPPAPPVEIVVIAGGNCNDLPTGIQCVDDSVCTEDGTRVDCDAVKWDIFLASTGILVQTLNAGQGDTVQANGLAPDHYSITQETSHQGVFDEQNYNVVIE